MDTDEGRTTGRARVLGAVWPGLVLVAVGVLTFVALYDALVEQDDLWETDTPLVEWFAAHRTPGMTTVMTVVTDTFGPIVLPVLVAIGCVVWARLARGWWEPLVLAGAMVVSTLLSSLLKVLVGRPRPDDELMAVPGLETTFSFPSGHTTGAATLVLVSGYLIQHRSGSRRAVVLWALASVVVVAAVGGSRMYLGYHFLTDVLAGICVAVVVLGGVVALTRWHDLRVGEGAGEPSHDVAPTA
ncbi:undecaprenyl-diphosphatase [Sediminihabitans luteus]|uniref:Undecaprenyl-diphosphatase n=1 Tax=Sediminihabitans luteus TaxID=1138585 RepID=A0A2M9CY66_9CELL|nr:phosphatase PAP2 family protein [Sediminihabitans luteus]PJJ76874.1 undecaprenyl-diphosphatase [Sediminihabitans luteus]GIJ00355.1 hypothetical protein Slu03_27320 [Sediminihabitans luteus]